MLSPTKEKGPIIGGKKLSAFQNLLHHRPRSHSWSHRDRDKGKFIIDVTVQFILVSDECIGIISTEFNVCVNM